jgi:hypothetical protein
MVGNTLSSFPRLPQLRSSAKVFLMPAMNAVDILMLQLYCRPPWTCHVRVGTDGSFVPHAVGGGVVSVEEIHLQS